MRIVFEALDKHTHDRGDFDCGSPSLNEFLKTQAQQRQKRNNAVTHVAINPDDPLPLKKIYGYYTISTYCLEYSVLPPTEAKKSPHKEKVPCLKLGRLARNKIYSKKGFGEIILMEVFRKALSLSNEVGLYLIEVDVLNEELLDFYKKYGFKSFLDDKQHLFITLETIQKLAHTD